MKLKTAAFYCMRKLWQLFSVTIVLLAVAVSVLKYTLPYANDYRAQIQQLINSQYGIELTIGEISASWQGNGPALELNNIGFKTEKDAPVYLAIEQTRVHINLWQSLVTRQLQSHYFVLDGVVANIDLPKALARTTQDNSASDAPITLLEGLFLGHSGHFAVENSMVVVTLAEGKRREVAIEQLSWFNDDFKHLGQGRVSIPGLSANELSANIALFGNQFSEAFGELYLDAKGINASRWLDQVVADDVTDIESDLNLALWGRIDAGELKNVQLEWRPSYLRWQQPNTQGELEGHAFEVKAGSMRFYPDASGWNIEVPHWQLAGDGKTRPPFQLTAQLGDQTQVQVKNLDIALINQGIMLWGVSELAGLSQRRPSGVVTAGSFTKAPDAPWQLWLNANNMSLMHHQGVPGFQDVTLALALTPDYGEFTLHSNDSHLLTGDIFLQAIEYQQLHVKGSFKKDSEWSLTLPELWLHNQDLSLGAELKLTLGDTPNMALYAELFGPDLPKARFYYPRGHMPQSTIDYLNRALGTGRLSETQVLYHGAFADFPYQDGSGQFLVRGRVEDGQMRFAPDWPKAEKLEAELVFEKSRMDIHALSGQLVNLPVNNAATVSIADLGKADLLTVDINTAHDASKLVPFLAATPIKDPLVDVFEALVVQGKVAADIQLAIDLNTEETITQGQITLADNTLTVAPLGVTFENATGRVNFVDDKVTFKGLKADYLGQSLDIAMAAALSDDGSNYKASIEANSQVDLARLFATTPSFLADYLSGEAAALVTVDLNFADSGFNYVASLQSDLTGVTSTLPAPYGKDASQIKALSVDVRGDDISNLITASLANQAYFNGILDNQAAQLTNAHVVLGRKDLGLAGSGLSVSVDIPDANMTDWLTFIDKLTTSLPETGSDAVAFNGVRGHIERVSLEGIPINDLDFDFQPNEAGAKLKLSAKELRGEVIMPATDGALTQVALDYLKVRLPDATEQESAPLPATWFKNLPPIALRCEDCQVDDYQLDKVNLTLTPDTEGVQINALTIDKGKHTLFAKGRWQYSSTDPLGETRLTGEFNSKDIGELFDEFDLTSTVKESRADIDFALDWQGAPTQFNVTSLNGELNWRLGAGHLAEVSDRGARVFSLLSLDSLVRKLTLDFRDVFSKGFFYNSMSGSMQISQGIANTTDTQMDGVPADVAIAGYADLNTRTLNYQLSVTPEVTSSIPVIVAWMVNPVSGLAALALDKVIHSAKVISELKFAITGTMDAPEITELDRKSKEVALPQAMQMDGTEQPAPKEGAPPKTNSLRDQNKSL